MGRHGDNIRKRNDGRWEARLITGYSPDGKAHYHSVYGKTYSEAKKKQMELAQLHGTPPPLSRHGVTFAQAAQAWMERKQSTVKESTFSTYTALLHCHLLPQLGPRKIADITLEDLRLFLQNKLRHGRTNGQGGLSPKTVSDLRAVLNLILQDAWEQGFIQQSVQLPSVTSRSPAIQTLAKQEQQQLEGLLLQEQTPLHLGILVALYAGLRIGEICALQWQDIHFDTGTLHVSRTLLRVRDLSPDAAAKTKILIDTPKTFHSRRVIPLPEFLLDCLQKNQRPADAYLLTGSARFLEPRVCLNKYKRVLRKACIRDHNFHALRHTFATRCVEQGFDIKSLSEIMGHANVGITMQRYVHPTLEQKRAQMNNLTPFAVQGQISGQKTAKPIG